MKKAFHWLFVHPIAFAWILAAIAIVLNWIVGSGAPPKKEHQAATEQHETRAEKHAEKKEAKAEEHAAKEAAKDEKHAAKEAAKEEKRLDKQEAKDEKHEAKAEKHETKGEKAAQQAAMAAGTAATAVATEQAVATESTTTETANASQDTSQASASVAEQAGNADAAATTATASTTTEVNENSSPEDLLLAAREAYWSGEYDRSVSLYQSLLKKDDKPDYKGELANVYWKQGKSTEAVSLYAEIAPWLAEQGRMAELQSIKVYADVVDPTKAAAIAAVIK